MSEFFQTIVAPLKRYRLLHGIGAALIYAVVVSGFVLVTLLSLFDLVEQYQATSDNRALLAQLQERANGAALASGSTDAWPAGNPFLDGASDTVAAAGLLQRLTNAVTVVGGSVASSEVDQRQAKNGYLHVTATIELEQPALQPLIYDIEAGMPFLYVDQLLIQNASSDADGGRVRVTLGISGLWNGGK
jgi:general secretion pathway protein M